MGLVGFDSTADSTGFSTIMTTQLLLREIGDYTRKNQNINSKKVKRQKGLKSLFS